MHNPFTLDHLRRVLLPTSTGAVQPQPVATASYHAPLAMPVQHNAMPSDGILGLQTNESLQHPQAVQAPIAMPQKQEFIPHSANTGGYQMPLPNLTSLAGKY